MPGSKRTFTYRLIPLKVEDTDRVFRQTQKILGWACDGDKNVTCHDVSGAELGAVTMSMTIQGRDRWWTTQLAQDILTYVLNALGRGVVRLDLNSEGPEPHTHRGYAHGRTKRYRERTPPSTKSQGDQTASTSSGTASTGT